ncbi:unnamed protein product [Discula destructiva]
MSRPWIFITPASRGIGHALTRHLLRTTTLPILATARSNPDAVKASLLLHLLQDSDSSQSSTATDRLHVLPLDVTDEPSIAAAAARAAELFPPASHHLHLALAVPGILHPEKALRQVDAERALMTYRVNTLGPLLLMKHFGDFLPKKSRTAAVVAAATATATATDHAVWATMSARVGSVSDNRAGGWYSYRSSKAGVNSLTKSFDLQLRARSGDRAMAIAYHPGTVRTDLSREFWGGVPEGKLFSAEFAAEMMVEVVTGGVGLEGRGRCWDWKGEEILP